MRFVLAAVLFLFVSTQAQAACSAPEGGEGDMRYATNYKVMAFCNGTDWVSMAGGTNAGGGAATTPAGSSGDIQFNSGGNFAADTGRLYWDETNNHLGIGNAAPRATVHATGGLAVGPVSTAISATLGDENTLQIATDTYFGGTYNDHSGYLVYSVMPSSWGTARLNFARSTNWGVYDTAEPVLSLGSNVGIGTTSPAYRLDVSGSIRAGTGTGNKGVIVLTEGGAGNTGYVAYHNPAGVRVGFTGYGVIGSALNHATDGPTPLRFITSGTERLRIDAAGNVGIGTAAPSVALEVAGVVSASDAVKVGASNLTCSATYRGAMRYTSGTMQVCNGTSWGNIGIGVPTGTISAFSASACPDGWSEYTPARGRFLRGIDNGASVDPSGTRAPGNTQDDAFQGHWHAGWSQTTGSDAPTTVAIKQTNANLGRYGASTPITDEVNGEPRIANETRPKNVAVIFCQYSGFQSQIASGAMMLNSLTDVSVAGATNGQVLTYYSGTWTPATASGGRMVLADEKTAGTAGGTCTSGSWGTRALNTERFNSIGGASLSSNQFVLPAGTYEIEADSTFYATNRVQIRLYNVTDATAAVYGMSVYSASSSASPTSRLKTVFTIAATKTFRIEYRCNSTSSSNGLGVESNFAGTEVFTVVMVAKLG